MMLEAPRLFNVGIVHGYPELVRATPNPIVGSSPGWVNGTSSQRAVLGNAPEKAKVASGVNGHWRGLARPAFGVLCRPKAISSGSPGPGKIRVA
ncbi:hypothetical protein HBI49_043800 [Parastagonospora nodorum]|nr:hypothetical protein HBH46_035200 [Parastagonospora nodorum]KAH4958532.1 hypothetical protein HBI78_177210 [Parastagonospora nodorum]KAH5377158.1 hypothetical protein HBI49_043800 [Parastagonospora nodorum]KAH6310519.1 hypothetical protein HBI39_071240 [Parastagonospora nodorum]KAH6529910.1 hypothetical protein HBI07_170510 [Parastagonospora nodorum]